MKAQQLAHDPGFKQMTLYNKVICALIILSVADAISQGAFQIVVSAKDLTGVIKNVDNVVGIYAYVYLALVLWTIVNLIAIVAFEWRGERYRARMATRVAIVSLILSFLNCMLINGVVPVLATYLWQFVWVIAYQVYNDPNLSRPQRFSNPFKRQRERFEQTRDDAIIGREVVREVAQGNIDPKDLVASKDHSVVEKKERTKYIPLNFFNMFWIFMVASVVGLAFETVFCLLERGVLEDRAGLLWGPFSPIYGLGALLMTIALNRFWDRNGLFIFVIAGVIGAAFEFAVSWYMETAFGVLAWDYSGAFMNIAGRTDLAHGLAWGMLGLFWIRLILPTLMNIIDVIPLKWRASVTIVALVFMLVNASMTVLALDCWSQRVGGIEPETQMQQYFAENFDNDYMQNRFQTMGINEERAQHAQQGRKR